VWQFPKPLVAAVNGHALAGGLDLCVLCDFRIASATAIFGHPEIKFGAPRLRRCSDFSDGWKPSASFTLRLRRVGPVQP
jgi:1,4-dihydroxy-2-naphthoyl-CoA synthase